MTTDEINSQVNRLSGLVNSALPTIPGSSTLQGSDINTGGVSTITNVYNSYDRSDHSGALPGTASFDEPPRHLFVNSSHDYFNRTYHFPEEEGPLFIPDHFGDPNYFPHNTSDAGINEGSVSHYYNESIIETASSGSLPIDRPQIWPGPAIGNSSFENNFSDLPDYNYEYEYEDEYEYKDDYEEDYDYGDEYDYAYKDYPQDSLVSKPTSKPLRSNQRYKKLPFPLKSNKVDIFNLPQGKPLSRPKTNSSKRRLRSLGKDHEKLFKKSKKNASEKDSKNQDKKVKNKRKSSQNDYKNKTKLIKSIKKLKKKSSLHPLKLYKDKRAQRKMQKQKRNKRSSSKSNALKIEDVTWF